jgi:peptidoglycan/xylan/chitin deacetylase (PgdA/CDA1 family)
MRLSRSRKLVLLGTALVIVGVAGRASAGTTTHRDAAARPAVSASAPAKATGKPATKPAPEKSAARGLTKGHIPSGPAGSRMTTGSKAVALTFDDGPDPATTPQLLKMLAQQHVHATFCLVGRNVQKHPDLVRKIVAGGHTVCNHTWSHSLTIGKLPAARIKADLARTSAAIHQAAPKAKIKYFRAPGGNFTPGLVAVARQLGMTSIYWRVDPRDWDHPKGETDAQHKSRVIWRVEHYTHNGAIVLSHDYAQPGTIAAYRTLLPWLHKRFQLTALPT